MCGISGLFYFTPVHPVKDDVIRNMACSLKQRGPDATGIYVQGNIGLGFTRLAIIDLSPAAMQPMKNEDGTIFLVFNGEIYNYRDLRRELVALGHSFISNADSETVLHAYEEYGTDCLDKLDGMFAFAVWDAKTRQLFLARDRFGIKPLHYVRQNGMLAFASESKALLQIDSLSTELDAQALWNYLSFMQVPAPLTIYRQIRKMLPAQAIVVKENGDIRSWFYWDISCIEDGRKTEEEWAEELRDLFSRAMRTHLHADVPVGVALSGGFDSSLVTAFAAKETKKPLATFSVRFPDHPFLDEGMYQQLAVERFHTEHHELNLRPDWLAVAETVAAGCAEPFAISSALPLYLLCREASSQVKVLLSGDGGDELFAGYDVRYEFFERLSALRLVPRWLWRRLYSLVAARDRDRTRPFLPGGKIAKAFYLGSLDADEQYLSRFSFFNREQKKMLFHRDVIAQVPAAAMKNYPEILAKAPEKGLHRYLYLDAKTALADEMLAKADLCSALAGIEIRVPLLDRSFAEAVFRIPVKFKYAGGTGKRIMKKAFAQFVPDEITRRNKAGFVVPVWDWMKSVDWREVGSVLDKLLDNAVLQKYVAAYDKEPMLWGQHLWIVYALYLWVKTSGVRT